jgi:hypothetical protein
MIGASKIRDQNRSRCHRDEETVDKLVGRIDSGFLRWSDVQVRDGVAAVPDAPSDLPGRGG